MIDDVMQTATDKYLETLLLYFEEEIMGEAYFYGLAEKFNEPYRREKMELLAKVERHAAECVRPLLVKYKLRPRSDDELKILGQQDIEQSYKMGWDGYIDYMVERFPKYMPEFHALEVMAPKEDIAPLQQLTQHEIVAIEFANLEQAGDENSTQPLLNYLNT